MAPISEKRQQSALLKDNVKENHQMTKAKVIQQSQPSVFQTVHKPEILDFRESWLQEIELYKDHVKAQQLLTQHNHVHTPDGCNPIMENPGKRRIRAKSESEDKLNDDGLVLKRAREDNHNSSINSHINNRLTSGSNATTTNTINVSSSNSTNGNATTSSANSKLGNQPGKTYIVNPYHVILINSNELDMKSSKYVTEPVAAAAKQSTALTPSKRDLKYYDKHISLNKGNPSSLIKSPARSKSPIRTKSPVSKTSNANSKLNNFQDEPKTITNFSSSSTKSQSISKNNNTNNNNNNNKKSMNDDKLVTVNDVNATFNNNTNLITTKKEHNINSNNSNITNASKTKTQTQTQTDNSNSDAKQPTLDEEYGSGCEDEVDDFAIDDADAYETSDDSEDEYRGCLFCIDSEEEADLDMKKEYDLVGLNLIKKSKPNSQNESPKTHHNDSDKDEDEYVTPKSPFTPSLFPNVPPYWTFSSHVEKGPVPLPDLQKVLKWRLSSVMPKIVRRVVANSGFRLIRNKSVDPLETNDWIASWEKHMKSPCFRSIRSHQKFNHLPGTFKIGRKDSVWRNIKNNIAKFGKKEWGFMQKTYVLPADLEQLKKAWPSQARKGTKWIIKPPAAARGSGVKVISRWSEFPKQKPLIVQRYIEKPLLINGSKFDLRLYVIITSINPLRIFLHTDGLARFAAVQYSGNVETLNDRCMHLTNYSINKFSANYTKNEDIHACQGHKWTLKSLWSYFRDRGINTKKLWSTLRNLVVKTVIGGEACLNRMYKTNVGSRYNCYELFGFDVLLDENLTPWLLEVNISPSLHSDLPLDLHIKGPLIQAVLNCALYQVPPKLTEEQERNIKNFYSIAGPLCYDRRIFTTKLTQEEIKKHNFYTGTNIEEREEYLETILDDLTPDDVRCLITSEDELARSAPLERIFPSSQSYTFLKYIDGARYYNRLLDAWETKYGKHRMHGIKLLRKFCERKYHLETAPSALEKEPSIDVDIFELNQLYKTANKSMEVQVQQSQQTQTPNVNRSPLAGANTLLRQNMQNSTTLTVAVKV